MEVDEDAETHVFRADGHIDDVGLAAPAAGGVHPDPEPDRVDAMLLQDLEAIFLVAGLVVEQASLGFHLGQPTDVGALGEGRGGLNRTRDLDGHEKPDPEKDREERRKGFGFGAKRHECLFGVSRGAGLVCDQRLPEKPPGGPLKIDWAGSSIYRLDFRLKEGLRRLVEVGQARTFSIRRSGTSHRTATRI